jgi:hypothetical protein
MNAHGDGTAGYRARFHVGGARRGHGDRDADLHIEQSRP